MKRVLALVAAVAMVVGAVALRGGGSVGDGGVGGGASAADVLRLHCAAELAQVCELLAAGDDRIDVGDGRPGSFADSLLAGEDLSADVWLAPRPWVEAVRALDRDATLGESSEVLARSPLVLAAFDSTVPDCGGAAVGWRCIGDAAGTIRPGIEGLDDTAGLFTIAQAGAAFFGTAAYATNDFETPPGGGGPPFVDWASTILRAVPTGSFQTPLETMLRTGAATFDFAASIEAVATSAIAGTRQEGSLRVIYPSPMATVDVVAVPLTGGDGAATEELVALVTGSAGSAALAQAGWRVDGAPLADGLDATVTLPADDGLPELGVVAALRDRLG